MPFDPTKDFTGISMLGASSVLETGPSIKVDSVGDLVAYAKQHPGTAFGTPGTGTSMHLAGVMFDQLTGAGMQHIPYKGSAQGINDLLGGHLPIMFDNLPAPLPHVAVRIRRDRQQARAGFYRTCRRWAELAARPWSIRGSRSMVPPRCRRRSPRP